jgi:hypothetical protein
MTKQDYAAEAADINQTLVQADIPVMVLIEFLAARCTTLAADNPRFDRERFMAACLRGVGAPHRQEARES